VCVRVYYASSNLSYETFVFVAILIPAHVYIETDIYMNFQFLLLQNTNQYFLATRCNCIAEFGYIVICDLSLCDASVL